MICISVFGKDQEEVLRRLEAANGLCDIIEIRLDLIKKRDSLDLGTLFKKSKRPLIATNRAFWEGGSFNGPEEERIGLLIDALESGFPYVDIEYKTEIRHIEHLLKSATEKGARVILSYHNFEETEDSQALLALFDKMSSLNPHIIKIVTMAKKEQDFLNLIPLFTRAKDKDLKIISFCMGEKGKFSRLFCLYLGSFLSFSALDEDALSAPGQIPISNFKKILTLLNN